MCIDSCISATTEIFSLSLNDALPIFEEISIFSNSGHLGYRTALTDTILKGDHLKTKKKKSSPLKLLGQSKPILAEMILRWSPFKIVSVSTVLYPRWPPLLKIEISTNGYSSNLGTFWLKIEQFWPFEEISIFSNGGHLGYRTVLTDTILKGDHLRIISWPPLLKIEISSNGQNCSILSQKVPKFELYKHNDELFNIYYGIFYEL
jgi:hypothetical protein